MAEEDVTVVLGKILNDFAGRHCTFATTIDEHFRLVSKRCLIPADISPNMRHLIGAYFTHEYSIEAAALGNPSMVASPDQSGMAPGSARFIMTLRAIGEGHISSIEFRTGVVSADLTVTLEPPASGVRTGSRLDGLHDRIGFGGKLADLDALDSTTADLLELMPPQFTMADLEGAMRTAQRWVGAPVSPSDTSRVLHWLASSHYRTTFDPDTELSQRVIFPAAPTESRGMEDVRLVRFVHDDGQVVYYGTYTAFDGHQILPQLLETTDFATFDMSTMIGRCAQNKGIALFPRKLNGRYVALGRQDNVNNFLMTSDDIRVWEQTEKIQEPERPWELMQLGNCGSPLETEAGWLVITHGVGPMRRYSLGALLLDRDDPARVIGHLREPLLTPIASEREGYVPNVVYSCGSMIHGGQLVLPYGFADLGAGIATVPLDDLLSCLTST
jgi:predicted GH43/DUF377 family glycosyl hydrolase